MNHANLMDCAKAVKSTSPSSPKHWSPLLSMCCAKANCLQYISVDISGLTTWVCFAPRTVVACSIPLCALPIGIYAFLDKTPLSSQSTNTTTTRLQNIEYTPLREEYSKDNNIATKIIQEVVVLYKVFPVLTYYFITNFCLHVSLTAVLTTLTFPTSPFSPRDHYQYYRLVSDAGILFGGMELVLISCLCAKWAESWKIRRVWIMVLFNVSCLIFYVFASWYRFLPNVYVLFALVFVQGVIYGSILVRAIAIAVNLFHNQHDKGTAMGFVAVGLSVGRLAAGFLGLFVEQYLREHCTHILLQGRFCLARAPSLNAWDDNIHCK